LENRRSGVLLHPASLHGVGNIGDFSHAAYRFIDWLQASGQSVWQVLPLGPTHVDGCPYQCLSTHAGNPLFISLDWLVDRGWLDAVQIQQSDYSDVARLELLQQACAKGLAQMDSADAARFEAFCQKHVYWLEDYARFITIKQLQAGEAWMQWPEPLRMNRPADVDQYLKPHQQTLQIRKFEQFVFFQQWSELRDYAHARGVHLFGDLPIFVSGDSADLWSQREYFRVDGAGQAEVVAGVPPDAFTAEGQRWGNPLYDWQALANDDFSWWLERLRTHFELFDIVRIDHFRGLESYWEIPASSPSAKEGRWCKAPGAALLKRVQQEFHGLPLVAEDLGIITRDVDVLRRQFSLPGMKVLQFAFDGDRQNLHLPHNHSADMVAYTGTHDNDTSLSWYHSASEQERHRLREYLQCSDHDNLPWPMIRSVQMSVANMAIIPMQDVLGLGAGNRMNLPGTTTGNWCWRFDWHQLNDDITSHLRYLTEQYGRLQEGAVERVASVSANVAELDAARRCA